MRRPLIVLASVFALMSSNVLADEALYQAIDEDYAYLEELYLYLHQNPELSYQEEQTMARIAGELRGLGFEVTENVGGFGLVGVLENGAGPTVLIRTDLDALPLKEQTGLPYASVVTGINQVGEQVSIMHACGHDIHMSVFVGTARRLVEMRDQWRGTLVMIGQPAEERGGGARAMLADGLYERFPKPDYNLALHDAASAPAGTIGYTPGYALANVDSVDIVVHGIGGHGAIYGYGHGDMYRDIAAFFRDATPYPVSREDCLGTLKLLHAFYRSDEAGGWADVDSPAQSTRLGRPNEAVARLYRTEPPGPGVGAVSR